MMVLVAQTNLSRYRIVRILGKLEWDVAWLVPGGEGQRAHLDAC